MTLFHAPRRESRKQAGKLNTACIAIEGSRAACGESLSFGSAAASLQCVTPPELQVAAASAVPNAFGSIRHHAFCCFPHASPVLVFGAGKQKTVPRDCSKPVISLRYFGAGEGIRTLDPNLGKVATVIARRACLDRPYVRRCRPHKFWRLASCDSSHVREREHQKTPFRKPF
jgi:hypothetical protein